MIYLIAVATAELLLGLILLFAPEPFKKLCSFCDKIFLDIDQKAEPHKFWIGFFEIVLAGWLFYVASRFPRMGVILHPFWIIFLFFGVLYMFLPHWMAGISRVAHRKVLDIDEFVMGARRISGFIFIAVSIYIFYLAYLAASV